MKETYLSRDFRETAAQCFPSQAKELNAFFDARLNVLLAENADASKEKLYHLKRQILPGIAVYETLQRVMPKEEALQIVHGYVERLARTSHKQLATLLLIPGLYRLVPSVFVKSTRSVFGPAAGFDSKELQVGNGIWRVDIGSYIRTVYHMVSHTPKRQATGSNPAGGARFSVKSPCCKGFCFLPFLVFPCSILHAFSRLPPSFCTRMGRRCKQRMFSSAVFRHRTQGA